MPGKMFRWKCGDCLTNVMELIHYIYGIGRIDLFKLHMVATIMIPVRLSIFVSDIVDHLFRKVGRLKSNHLLIIFFVL